MTGLLIFDCDGVLVDSEPISNRVLAEVINELGWPISFDETIREFKGTTVRQVWERVGARLQREIGADVDRDFRARERRALEAECRAVPGIPALIETLATPYCVASNGPHEKMRWTLGTVGLLHAFTSRIFSAHDVAHPKPHPDLFLYAAAQMGVAPERCVVLEDSPAGIVAARRAGMRPLGLAATATADRESLLAAGAEQVLDRAADLAPLL